MLKYLLMELDYLLGYEKLFFKKRNYSITMNREEETFLFSTTSDLTGEPIRRKIKFQDEKPSNEEYKRTAEVLIMKIIDDVKNTNNLIEKAKWINKDTLFYEKENIKYFIHKGELIEIDKKYKEITKRKITEEGIENLMEV